MAFGIIGKRGQCHAERGQTSTLFDILDPNYALSALVFLHDLEFFSGESKARLAILEGLLKTFKTEPELPGLYIIPSSETFFTERIEEILEDAHLLEASTLRRTFSVRANVASVKRDLRKLMNFIASKKKWAKGILKATSQTILIPKSVEAIGENILEIVPSLTDNVKSPVLICPGDIHYGLTCFKAQSKKDAMNHGYWSVEARFVDGFATSEKVIALKAMWEEAKPEERESFLRYLRAGLAEPQAESTGR